MDITAVSTSGPVFRSIAERVISTSYKFSRTAIAQEPAANGYYFRSGCSYASADAGEEDAVELRIELPDVWRQEQL